jgi:hypothetical protein
MADKYKTKEVGQISDKSQKQSLSDTQLLSLSEAAAFAEVSTRTIERHATFTKYQTVGTIRNGKKVKCYELSWLTTKFKNVVSETETKTNKNNGLEDTTTTKTKQKKQNVVSETFLQEHLANLTKELQFKSDLIIRLQDSNDALLESEQKTKMLLADLQFQQKTLLLDKPTANQSGKKDSKIWWALFCLLIVVCGIGLYFGIHFIQDLINKIHF